MNNDKVYDKAEEMAEKVLCTGDKCVCPKIKEAGLCSGCDVFMALRDYYAEEEIKSFALSDWQEIKEILDSGKAKEVFEVGDEREETLITGEKITLVLLGFGQDEKVSGGKVNMTIGLKNLMDGDFEMNLTHTNEGGWEKSRMRTVYMERVFKLLPEELRNIIVPVKKSTSAGGGSTDITVSEDKLFLFSLANITISGGNRMKDLQTVLINLRGAQQLLSLFCSSTRHIEADVNGNPQEALFQIEEMFDKSIKDLERVVYSK